MPRALMIALFALVLAPAAVQAQSSMPECTCRNLESLQQEYQNAVYLEGYMKRLAEHLRAVELAQVDMNKNDPSNPKAGLMPNQASATARQAYEDQNRHLPFPTVTGYTGPSEVSMIRDTCRQSARKLAELQGGSPCEAIAEAALAHEAAHRAICERMGPDAYWSRMPSEVALEEVDMYKGMAANLKAELRRVLEVSDLRLISEWQHVMSASELSIALRGDMQSQDLTAASSRGDRWTMTASAEGREIVEKLTMADIVCTGSVPVSNQLQVTMATDGLTFDLDLAETSPGGEFMLSCPTGAMPYPSSNMFTGNLAAGQRLVAGDNPIPQGWWTVSKLALSMAGFQVTGDPKVVLSLTCEGQ
jgi:hypothetical protein